FAVVAAPITALNFQEFASRRFGLVPRGDTARQWAIAGRFLTGLACAGLVVAAWPGWLLARPYDSRRWTVEQDPSLQRAAERIREWRQAGLRGPDEFGFAPLDAADHFAWLCPEEQGFVDHRLQAFPAEAVTEYLTVLRGLVAEAAPDGGAGLS